MRELDQFCLGVCCFAYLDVNALPMLEMTLFEKAVGVSCD